MRIVFMATGEIAEAAFLWLLQSDHDVCGLVTQPDRPVGRKQMLTAPGVKNLATQKGIPVIQPEKIREKEALAQIRDWEPDVIVVMAYGQILPQSLIEIPKRAIINLHASLLPKYRGASCIQGALKAGDAETGWSVIHVVKKLDAGNVIFKKELKILEGETGGKLHDRLAEIAPEALAGALALFESQAEVPGEIQDETITSYVPKLLREDGKIDWTQDAQVIARMVCAYDPWPGTFALLEGKRVKIFPPLVVSRQKGHPGECLQFGEEGIEIACGTGSVLIQNLQPEGSRRMTAKEMIAGRADTLRKGLA